MLGETLNEAVLDKCINKQKSLLKSKSNATTRRLPSPRGAIVSVKRLVLSRCVPSSPKRSLSVFSCARSVFVEMARAEDDTRTRGAGRAAAMGVDADLGREPSGAMDEIEVEVADARAASDDEDEEEVDVSVCPVFTTDDDPDHEDLPRRNLDAAFASTPTLPKKRRMPMLVDDANPGGARQLPVARVGLGGATGDELSLERMQVRHASASATPSLLAGRLRHARCPDRRPRRPPLTSTLRPPRAHA